jgi:hypothetical protein
MSIITLAYTFSDRLVRKFCGEFRRRMWRCHALARRASLAFARMPRAEARGASLGTMGSELW